MFGNNIVGGGSSLSLTKILGGISSTLNFANKAIPLYLQVKPIVANAKDSFGVIKNLFNNDKKEVIKTNNVVKENNMVKRDAILDKKNQSVTNNAPVFFQ